MKINTEEEYDQALKDIERLWDISEESIENFDLFNNLVDAVEEYEEIHFPIPEPSEEDLIEFRKDQECK